MARARPREQVRSRGHHAGLTREAVLEAAVRLVDEQGLTALSMRRLGAELGVEAMALYHHVGSKEELLDGLVEHLFSQAVPAQDAAPEPVAGDPDPWRAVMRRFAHDILQTLLDHPHLVPVVLSRPAATPPVHALLERALVPLRGAGFPPGRSLDLVYALIGFVVGHVATGGGAGDGSAARREILAGQDLSDFPLLARAVEDAPVPGAASPFDTTLEALLAWFEPQAG
ncbi:MAG: TetR/AcrR family transcriptional regulator [Actinomycetales bacterium]|nr:TetR/AcrR family transcriptional regulator [Actinomycetales bacterium]